MLSCAVLSHKKYFAIHHSRKKVKRDTAGVENRNNFIRTRLDVSLQGNVLRTLMSCRKSKRADF